MFLADIWTGTAELTGLVILMFVLSWLAKQCEKFINAKIEEDREQIARVKAGTMLMNEFAPRVENKVDAIQIAVEEVLQCVKSLTTK